MMRLKRTSSFWSQEELNDAGYDLSESSNDSTSESTSNKRNKIESLVCDEVLSFDSPEEGTPSLPSENPAITNHSQASFTAALDRLQEQGLFNPGYSWKNPAQIREEMLFLLTCLLLKYLNQKENMQRYDQFKYEEVARTLYGSEFYPLLNQIERYKSKNTSDFPKFLKKLVTNANRLEMLETEPRLKQK